MAGLRVCLFMLFSLIFVLLGFCDAAKPTIEEKLKEDSDLSEFYSLLERNTGANNTLMYRQVTIFAPTNEAFQKRKGESFDDSIVHYHMTNLAMSLSDLQMQYSVNSELEGNPPLWITRRADRMHNDLFVNNARVLPDRSYHSTNRIGKRQILHVIDEVLVPVLPSSTASISTMIYSPNAYQFLERSEDLAIGSHRLRSFRQKVNQSKKQDVFRVEGRHTFFIPVEEGFKPTPRPELIDAKVIDGHVIPNHVLFTHATQDDIPFETLAFGDNLKVTVSFTTTHDGKESQTYVKSNTLLGDSKHSMGVVLADIVKANIPVKNGVVHLIQRPLMVVDTTVTQFLEGIDKVDGPLFKFHEVMSDLAYDFLENLKRMKDVTLFAPSNEAWKDKRLSNIISNKQRLHEILHLHLVRERLPMEKIIQNNMHQIYQVPSAAERKYLYFNVIQNGSNQTLTVEAGGVNATVIQPNIAATNGIVHIINRVLGVPYTTVYEKLNTDPMLNDTHFLGRRLSFNQQLMDTTHRYTYLVPRDRAWQKFETEHPTAHKKIFMEDFKYHTRQILERHLVVADRAYTMADMKLHANETHPIVLPSVRDTLRLRIKETDKNYYIEWQNLWIHVFRPDVECTNGIIHVIDYPLITASDITVTGSTSNSVPNILITILLPTILLNVFSIWVIQH